MTYTQTTPHHGSAVDGTAADAARTNESAARGKAPRSEDGGDIARLLEPDGTRVPDPALDPWIADLSPHELRALHRDMVLTRRLDAEGAQPQLGADLDAVAERGLHDRLDLVRREVGAPGEGHCLRPGCLGSLLGQDASAAERLGEGPRDFGQTANHLVQDGGLVVLLVRLGAQVHRVRLGLALRADHLGLRRALQARRLR